MTQAILITAYKNFHHLEEIVIFFKQNFRIYIHIDKKSDFTDAQILSLKKRPQVEFISQQYNVNWGGINHLNAILHLGEKAIKDTNNFYFHLISGHDFPIKSTTEFFKYFEANQEKEFISFFNVPKPGWADNEGMDRLEYYNFYDVLNSKIPFQNHFIRKFIELQKKLRIKRAIPSDFPVLYGGSTWWSLSRQCLEYVINYTKENPWILKRFKHTLCSEEFYFQTIILDSPLFKKRVVNNNLRYIDWVARNGNNPAVLDESDLSKLKDSDAFFARKFDYPVSANLIVKVKEEILNPEIKGKNSKGRKE